MTRIPDSEFPPPEVIAAAALVGRYFSERNVKVWALGPCAARGLHDELAASLRAVIAYPLTGREIDIAGARDARANAAALLAMLPGGR